MRRKGLAVLQLLCCLLAGAMMAACGGGGDGGSGGTGTLQVALTDDSAVAFDSVVISIREVRATPAGSENSPDGGLPLIASFTPPKQVEILDLAFQQQVLGEAVLPAGEFHQVRLVLAENSDPSDPANYITLQGAPDEKIPLRTPSAQQSGLKVNAEGTFEVKAGEINTVFLDFNPQKAIVQAGNSGNWNFKPTGIRIIQVANELVDFGTLSGTVMPEAAWPSAVVSAVDSGSGTILASGRVNPDDGSFRIFLPAGSYEVRAAADGFQDFSSAPVLYDVTVGQDTDAGTITLTPVAL